MSEVAHSPQLRFPEFSGDWEENALSSVAIITTGSTPRTLNDEYYNGDIAFVSPADIQGNRFVRSTKTTITELGLSVIRAIKKKSTLFVCIGSTIGKVSQASENCATNQQINTLTAKKSFDNDFIYSLLELKAPRIKLLAGVQAVPQINKSEFSKFKFIFPSKPEQQKIAAFLTAVDNKIEQLSKKQELLGEYKKGLMQKIFSQAIRFHPKGTSSQAQGEIDDGSDFPDWDEKSLGDVFSGIKGRGLSKGNITIDGLNKCILYGELYTTYPEVIKNVVSRTNSDDGVKSKVGDLLVPCSTTTTGIDLADVTAINEDNISLGGDISILRLKKDGNSVFFAYYLTHYKKFDLAKYGQGSTIVHLYYSHFKKIDLKFPSSVEEQTKIASFLSSIDTKIEQVVKQLDESKQFKKALLQQMFV
jgi:type I restriction enzyme S subunit